MLYRYEKQYARLKKTLDENDEEHRKEREEMKRNFEKYHSGEVNKMLEELSDLKSRAKQDSDDLLSQIERLKVRRGTLLHFSLQTDPYVHRFRSLMRRNCWLWKTRSKRL